MSIDIIPEEELEIEGKDEVPGTEHASYKALKNFELFGVEYQEGEELKILPEVGESLVVDGLVEKV